MELGEEGDPQHLTRLFQYGSNMHHERFVQRITGSFQHAPSRTPLVVTLLGTARLGGWRLRANLWSATRASRVANIVSEDGAEVWGALYEIAAALVTRCDGERSVTDRLEGHRTMRDPENYAKICVTVDLEREPMTAWTYVGLHEAIVRCERKHPGTVCNTDYVQTVVAGARAIGVPRDYLGVIVQSLCPS